ncbi:MAG: hypothetical protein JSS81_26130 [Acidobacteria bacterium]|nr:hypothetical protein [Acidobacteriota bacterium]
MSVFNATGNCRSRPTGCYKSFEFRLQAAFAAPRNLSSSGECRLKAELKTMKADLKTMKADLKTMKADLIMAR